MLVRMGQGVATQFCSNLKASSAASSKRAFENCRQSVFNGSSLVKITHKLHSFCPFTCGIAHICDEMTGWLTRSHSLHLFGEQFGMWPA